MRTAIMILLAAALPAAAQGPKTVGPEELATVLKEYRSIESISATFKQKKSFQDIKMELKSEGRFEISRPKKSVVWEVSKPSRLQVTMTEKELTLVSDESTQSFKLSELGGDKASRSLGALVAWLELDAPKISAQYNVALLEPSHYKFTPKQKDSAVFDELEMWLDKKGYLTRLKILERSGDRLEIDFATPKVQRAK